MLKRLRDILPAVHTAVITANRRAIVVVISALTVIAFLHESVIADGFNGSGSGGDFLGRTGDGLVKCLTEQAACFQRADIDIT